MEHKIDRGIGWVLLLSLLALFSCNDGREEQMHTRLRQWDAQLAEKNHLDPKKKEQAAATHHENLRPDACSILFD